MWYTANLEVFAQRTEITVLCVIALGFVCVFLMLLYTLGEILFDLFQTRKERRDETSISGRE